jgi:GNAT superfamily N-acetyltransferase
MDDLERNLMSNENYSVHMVRESLDDLPEFALPAPYSIRWYRPGDKENWLAIQLEAEKFFRVWPALYEREFGRDDEVLARRQAYLCDGQGRPIGTATAWYKPDYEGQAYGQIHWVAIVPAHQRRGLAKPLLSAVCHRMRDLGHERAYLATSTGRIEAVGLYLKFGFVPKIRTDKDIFYWQVVANELDHQAVRVAVGSRGVRNVHNQDRFYK